MPISAASLVRRVSAVNPLLLDGALALTLVVGTWLWEIYDPGKGRPTDALSLTLTLLVNGPLVLRRQAPVAVLVLSTGAAMVYHLLGYHLDLNSMGPLVTLLHRRRPPVLGGLPGRGGAARDGVGARRCQPARRRAVGGPRAVAPGVGLRRGRGHEQAAAGRAHRQLAELADQLRREQDAAARVAVTHERVRIARELHDVVAHHMSVISVQAGSAVSSPCPTRPPRTPRWGSSPTPATRRWPRCGGCCRSCGSRRRPGRGAVRTAPGLQSLEPLAERIRAAGLPLAVIVEGAARPLPPAWTCAPTASSRSP